MLYLNENFNVFTFVTSNVESIKNLISQDNLLEIFSFKDEQNIISYDILEFEEENKFKEKKLSDLILRNLLIDLKKFSQNKFDSNEEDILFTKINI